MLTKSPGIDSTRFTDRIKADRSNRRADSFRRLKTPFSHAIGAR
jgi:hypothetical protein